MLTTKASAEVLARTALRERLARLGQPPEQQDDAHAEVVARAVVEALDGGAEPTDPDAVAVLRFLREGDVELLDVWLRETR